jgi:hypothetical protein
MRERPLPLTIVAIAYVLAALSMPVQVMFLYDHDLSEFEAALEKLTVMNWAVIAMLMMSAVLLWRGAPAAKLSLPLTILLVAVNNFFVGYYATDFSPIDTAMASAGFLLLHLPLLHPKVRALVKSPEKRWWLRAERKVKGLPVVIDGSRLRAIRAETFDISETGVFILYNREMGVGDVITLKLKFGTFHQFRCQGRVVRRSDASGNHPSGVGVQFTNLSTVQRRELRRHLERIMEV